jgi:HNH endonuclease/ribosomal L20-like protein
MAKVQKDCVLCGRTFYPQGKVHAARRKFCSTKCMHESQYTPFEDRVAVEPNTGCELWTGTLFKNGYGQAYSRKAYAVGARHQIEAHRLAWIMANGDIPDGLFVLHKCDTKACVNPRHLFLGTHMDNMADMIKKGRAPIRDSRGEKNGRAKISAADAARIRDLRKSDPKSWSYRNLSKEFGVSKGAIWYVATGRTWRGDQ